MPVNSFVQRRNCVWSLFYWRFIRCSRFSWILLRCRLFLIDDQDISFTLFHREFEGMYRFQVPAKHLDCFFTNLKLLASLVAFHGDKCAAYLNQWQAKLAQDRHSGYC